MGFWATVGVAVTNAAAACLGAGVAAAVWAAWYHVSSREGEAGFFVVGIALLGLIGGLVVGVICARIVAASASPGFLRAVQLSLTATLGLLVLATAIARLGADFPPTIDGKELAVEIEVRLPAGMAVPSPNQHSGLQWMVTITADSGARRQSVNRMDAGRARHEDGRWIVLASVHLHTSDAGKSLGITLADDSRSQFFRLPLASRPTRADMSWSAWQTEPHTGDLAPIPATEAVAMRYRVQFYQPLPP
jgi:hypothetical protein